MNLVMLNYIYFQWAHSNG